MRDGCSLTVTSLTDEINKFLRDYWRVSNEGDPVPCALKNIATSQCCHYCPRLYLSYERYCHAGRHLYLKCGGQASFDPSPFEQGVLAVNGFLHLATAYQDFLGGYLEKRQKWLWSKLQRALFFVFFLKNAHDDPSKASKDMHFNNSLGKRCTEECTCWEHIEYYRKKYRDGERNTREGKLVNRRCQSDQYDLVEESLSQYKEVFATLDTDGNGTIGMTDLTCRLAELNNRGAAKISCRCRQEDVNLRFEPDSMKKALGLKSDKFNFVDFVQLIETDIHRQAGLGKTERESMFRQVFHILTSIGPEEDSIIGSQPEDTDSSDTKPTSSPTGHQAGCCDSCHCNCHLTHRQLRHVFDWMGESVEDSQLSEMISKAKIRADPDEDIQYSSCLSFDEFVKLMQLNRQIGDDIAPWQREKTEHPKEENNQDQDIRCVYADNYDIDGSM